MYVCICIYIHTYESAPNSNLLPPVVTVVSQMPGACKGVGGVGFWGFDVLNRTVHY